MTAATSPAVLTTTNGPIRTISLNRPEKHNAIDDELYGLLLGAVSAAAADHDVRVIVVRGEGRSFSSGRDTGELGRNVRRGDFVSVQRAQELNLAIRGCPKPVIAELKGHVIGKALETALAADIRVAASGTQLCFPEVDLGLVTDNAGATNAALLAGASRAKYMLMTGDRVDADRALAWGLVDFVVDRGEVEQFVAALARRLASKAPPALAMAKQLVDAVHDGAVRAGFREELLGQLVLFAGRGS